MHPAVWVRMGLQNYALRMNPGVAPWGLWGGVGFERRDYPLLNESFEASPKYVPLLRGAPSTKIARILRFH